MSELTSFIPAGGLGSRLHPHTLETPKPLLLMGSPERRVIDAPLEVSVEAASHTWVSTDYLADQVHEYLEGMPGVTALRDSRTVGSAGSLFEHFDELSGVDANGDMLILPSDHIYEGFSAKDFWQRHKETNADITLLTIPSKPYGEYVAVNGHDVLSVEKNVTVADLSTTGIFILRNKYLMDWLYRAQRNDIEYEACNIYYDIICPAVGRAAVASYSLGEVGGYWEDTGTPERYIGANMRISGGENVISPLATVHPEAHLDNCVVLGGAVLDARSALKNAIISTRNGKTVITSTVKEAA